MSIAAEIQRIKSNVASAYAALAARGAAMPASMDTDHLAATVAAQPGAVPIAYLEASGTQYVETGLCAGPLTRTETDLTVVDWDAGTYALSGSGGSRHAFGRGWSGSSASTGNSGKLYFGLGDQNLATTVALPGLAGVRHVYWIDAPSATAGLDVATFSLASSGTISTNAFTALLLAQRQNATTVRGQMAARLHGFRWLEDGEPVLDLMPVRFGALGVLLDKLTGTLYGNAGTGSFAIGPDL